MRVVLNDCDKGLGKRIFNDIYQLGTFEKKLVAQKIFENVSVI